MELADDHGDEAACATPLALGVAMAGRIEAGDDTDWFRLELSGPASVAIYTTGDLDTVGSLRDPSDAQIASDDDGGEGLNFHVESDQAAGAYYVRVVSYGNATGSYTLHARRFADVALAGTGETVRLWGTAQDGWTLDMVTDEPFGSGGEVTSSQGDRYVLRLDPDGVWMASLVAPTVGTCDVISAGTIRTLAGTGVRGFGGDGGPASRSAAR